MPKTQANQTPSNPSTDPQNPNPNPSPLNPPHLSTTTPRDNSKTEAFQELKQGVNDLGLGDAAQDLDLSDIVKGLPPGLRLRTPGLCAYYDSDAAVCHFHSANGVRARVAGPCSGKLDGVVPTWWVGQRAGMD